MGNVRAYAQTDRIYALIGAKGSQMSRVKYCTSSLKLAVGFCVLAFAPGFAMASTVATPTFSPAAGTYGSSQTVTISDSTSGATIYYTTNGSAPTTSSTQYTSAITVNSTETVKAMATKSGFTNSSVGTAAYTFVVPTPTFSPGTGSYGSSQTVTISDSNPAATIYYTTNGTTPTTSSTKYTSAITVNSSETVEALAVITGYTNSAVGSAAYTFVVPTPTFSPGAGTYGSSQTVTISDSTSGATIYYTTNGSAPTTSSTQYTSAITVNSTETVKAMATKSGFTNSSVGTAAYTFVVPTPTFSLVGGSYFGTQTVTVSDSNSAATIYYTTNGTTPTTSSTLYTGAITVSSTETLEALAVISGYSNSSPASATYTITTSPGTLSIYLSPPAAQSTVVSGAITETFDALSTGTHTTSYVSTAGIGTYTGSSTQPFAIAAPNEFGGATDSSSSTGTNYFAVGTESGSENPVSLTLAQPVSYFGFWWSAGDTNNRIALYSGSSLYGTFTTANLLTFLNNGSGTINAINGTTYETSAYFGNPNITSGTNDSGEPFAYVSFAITGATITQIVFYNESTTTGFESDNHSVIFNGNTVTIPTTYVPVETLTLGSQVASPVFTPAGGTPLNLGISSTTPGASINYTTSGTAPTPTTGTVCSTPCTIQVSAAETIKAIAYETGMTNSPVTSVTYTIPTLTVASLSNPSTYGSSVTFTATISSGPSGMVTFYDSGTSIGTGTISGATATFTTSTLAVGAHTITAGWVGNASYGSVLSSAITQTVNQEAQTISFSTIASQVVGTPLTLSATATSGLAVSFTSTTTGICTVSGTTATFIASGTCTIDANQTGNNTYAAATMVPQSFTVNGEPQTISFSTIAAQTVGTPLTLSATANSSLVVAFTSTTQSICTVSGTTATFIASGTCTIDANQTGNSTFAAATMVPQTFQVNGETQTISFSTIATQIVGTPLTLSATASSSLTVAFTSTTTGICTVSGTTATFITSGTCTIDANQAGNTIYAAATMVPQSFQVNDEAQTISFPSVASQTVGTPLALSATASSSLTVTFTSTTQSICTVSGTTATFITIGTCTIDANQAGNSTYAAATMVPQSFQVISPLTVSVTPPSPTLSAGETQQFTATVTNTSNTAVTWSISPAGTGTLSATGLYTAPATIATQQTLTVTATSQANSSQSASVTVTLSPTACIPNGYSSERVIAIDHTKVPNTDQANFPFLFNTTDPAFATIANGGHVASANGSDIIFTSDPSGQNVLNFEVETYNPVNGQIIAWVKIPTLSHSSDTILYMFYGNPNITVSQQNPSGVWDANYQGVYHLASVSTGTATDSTSNVNNAALTSVLAAPGEIDGAGSFNGVSSYMQLPAADFAGYPTTGGSTTDYSATFGAWFKTGSPGVILGQTGNSTEPGGNTNAYAPALYIDNTGKLEASMFWHGNGGGQIVTGTPYDDNNWHFAVDTYSNGSETLYIDGQNIGSQTQMAEYVNGPPYAYFVGTGYTNGWTATNNSWFYFNGSVDEVEVSNVARSSDWVQTQYLNQRSPAAFYTLYAENAEGVLPATVSLYASQIQQFAVTDTCSSPVTWSIQSGSQGSLTAGGLYTAPASISSQQTVTISAANQASGTTIGSAAVTLLPPPPPLSPASGPAGTLVTINGTGFGSSEGSSSVTVGGLPAVTLMWNNTQIVAQIPSGTATGDLDVEVTVGGQAIEDATFNVTQGLVGLTPAPYGTFASVTINTSGQTAPLIFNGTVGQMASVQISNSTFPGCFGMNVSILNPDGSTLASQSVCGNFGFLNPVTLPTTGIYSVVIAPIGSQGGTGSTNVLLSVFSEQAATITSGIPVPVVISIPGQEALFTFSGTAGQLASVQISNSTFPGCVAMNFSILNPDGSTLATQSTCTNTGFLNPVTLPTTAIYTLVIAPVGSEGGTGTATATVWVFSEQTGTITPGIPANPTISIPGQEDLLTFNGTAGQLASLQVSNSTIGSNCWAMNVSILNPDGSTLASQLVCGSTGFLNPVTLPATGTYTLVIAPFGINGGTGSASFLLSEFSEQTGVAPSGIPVPVSINSPGQEDLLTFSGTAGQLASALISNSTFPGCSSVWFYILNPDGSTLATQNVCGNTGFLNPVILPTTGIYTLLIVPVASQGGTGTATATVWVFSEQTGTITSGVPAPVTINIPGQEDLLTFSGTAGQLASAQISNATFPGCSSIWFYILNPDGSTLATQNVCGSSAFLNPVILPSTGTYTLMIAPVGSQGGTGSATATLWVFKNQAGTLMTTGALSVTPPSATLSGGQTQQFRASVLNTSDQVVTWSVSPSGAGTISATGLYTAPANVTSEQTVTVTATHQTETLTSLPPVQVAINIPGQTARYTFSGIAGQPASVQMSNSTFGGCSALWMYILNPDGSTLASQNTCSSTANIGPVTLPTTGIYTLLIAPVGASGGVGSATVSLTTESVIPTQTASASITLSPQQCASSGYAYQRSIVIDHTKVPNTDQANFPFLFNTTDPLFATTANGGHVTNSSGSDIIFSLDPGGITKLDHELEQYNPVTGQVVAWVRIPDLSHTTDTVLYVFYGNPNIVTSQQNPTGVWDSKYTGVYHLANAGSGTAPDSTLNGNTAALTSVLSAPGEIDGAGSFNGASSYMQIPAVDFLNYPSSGSINPDFAASFGVWFQTTTAGVLLGQTDGTSPGGSPGGAQPALYVDTAGLLRASLFTHGSVNDQIVTSTAYNDNNWHFAVDTYGGGTETLYVDGQFAGSQQADEDGYNSTYAYFAGTGETANWPATNGSWLYFNGKLDEVNVSSIARSADWIGTEYGNQSSPSTFYALYPENTELVIPGVVNLSDSQSQQFTVMGSVAGTCSSLSVIWSMPSGMPGTLTEKGIYTAPTSITSQLTVPITATVLGSSAQSISAVVTLMPAITVNLTPENVTLTGGQTQQFIANVANTNNTAVTWTVSPAGIGSISASGLYTATSSVATLETVTLTATSQADPTQSASATITLSPTPVTPIPPSPGECGSTGYNNQRTIVIDHTKIPNTDLTNFPFLFNTTDPSLATTANGGQVTSSSGYDIFFSTDPNGLSKLDHELEEYDPVHGQVIAWVRIPNLSHTTDTVLYMFYGNPNIIASQQNSTAVWDSDYTAVYHMATVGTSGTTDSTVNRNNSLAISSVTAASGEIDGAGGFNGTSSSIQIPETDFPNFPTGQYSNVGLPASGGPSGFSTSFGLWFKTASAGGILMQSTNLTCTFYVLVTCSTTGPIQAGDTPAGSWDPFMYVDDNGKLNAGGLVSPIAYNDNNWHFAVWTLATSGSDSLYVDGQNVASGQGGVGGYAPDYAYFLGATYTQQASEGNWDWLYFNGSIDEVTVSDIPRSSDWIQTEYNNQKSPATFYSFNPANSVQVVPSAISLYAAQSQQFAATVACDTPVSWSMPSGTQGVLTASGLYTAPSSITSAQTAIITATNQTNGATIGSGVVTLLPAPQPITLAASAQPPYTTGSSQAFSASLLDQDGTPQIGVTVTFAVSGANSIIGSATTSSSGVATFSYTGANHGTDTIQATAVANGQALTSNGISVSWIAPAPVNPVASVALVGPPAVGLTGLVGAFTDSNGAVVEPIAIGAAAGNFVVPAGATQLQLGVDSEYFPTNGGPGFVVDINGVPLTVPPTAMPWTWALGGLNNNYQYGVYNPGIQSGILDGTSPVIAASDLTQGEVLSIAYQSGTASSSYPLVPSVNANGNQSLITGVQVLQGAYFPTLYTTPSSYPLGQAITFNTLVTSAAGTPMASVPVTLNVTGANPQQLLATTDSTGRAAFLYAGLNAGADMLEAQATPSGGATLSSTEANVTWINYGTPPPVGSLVLTEIAHSVTGQVQGYDALATDASGNPVFNANVGLYVWGVDNFIQNGTTDVTGHVEFTYNHVNEGPFNLVAVESTNRNVVFSNVIPGNWNGPVGTNGGGNTITVNISSNNPVIMPNPLQLNGTVTDGNNLTPTITWSQVSGPGTATFANPSQATTTVSFSDVGNYVLQLSASDAAGVSGSVQWPVTVDPPVVNPQGWIANPVYGSTVTGLVPIIIAPGISLGSGVLSYYPAGSNNNVTILNADTTGSGQIGTLDTTMLANGSYWIQLQATDTGGHVGYSLILVTVAGNYKPGRVTATVTDLVVPSTGLAINIQRTYDSLNAGTSGDFGYGWNLGINVNLAVDNAGNVTFTLGGQRRTFYLAPQPNGFLPYYNVAFTPEPGFNGTLTDSNPGCADDFDFVVPDGSLWFCVDGSQYNPPGYIYTDPNGTAYTMSAGGNLQSIQDRSGNGLTITATGITSTTGLSVPFVRDSSNRITQITDPQGNIYQYGYDTSGNLETVTYPNTTTPSTYKYVTGTHYYLSGTDARSKPLPVTSYYASGEVDANGNPLTGRLQSVQDAVGDTTNYAYDLTTNTTTITYPQDASGNRGTATTVYDAYGMLLSSTDPLGNTTTNVYDGNHNLISATDPLGHVNTYAYDQNGNKISSTYPATVPSTNTTSTSVYNQFSEPTSTTDELGNVRLFNYDANYNPQSVTDSVGTLASFLFNPNLTLAAGAIGFDINANPAKASTFTYDTNGNVASRTDALGRTTSFTYDTLGRKLSVAVPAPNSAISGGSSNVQRRSNAHAEVSGGGGLTTSTVVADIYSYGALICQTASVTTTLDGQIISQYDASCNGTSTTDIRGNTTTYTYDSLNRLILITYPTQPVTTKSFTYDFRNNLIDETDQDGHVTHHVYDLAGRLISVTKAYGTSSATTTTFTRYNDGKIATITDALGHTTTYTYDAAGNVISVVGVQGNFQFGYDNARNRISQTDGNGNTTQLIYDSRKRLIKIIYPDTTTKIIAYDGASNVISITDQAGHVVQYNYDAANELQSVVQLNHPIPSRNTNTYSYDADGDLLSWSDENGHTSQATYDALFRPVSKTLPDGSLTESATYDPNNNLISLTNYAGKTANLTYDAVNRLTALTPDPSVNEPNLSYAYTPTGKRASMTDGGGTTSYAYDALDRLISKATPEGTLTYTYDAAGHVASLESSNTNGASVSYTYDDLNRLSTVVDNRLTGNQTTTYSYDSASNLATVTYPNGIQATFTFDQLNRVSQLVTPVAGYTYQRDPTGNKTSVVELNGRTSNWTYDGINQLTNETIASAPSGKNGSVSYTLDAVGNRLSDTSSLSGIGSGSYTYNVDDRATGEGYDANGDTTATSGKAFGYDSLSRLTSMSGGAVTLLYDGSDNRVSKTANGVTTKYLIDDLSPTGYPQVVEELTSGSVTRRFTYGFQRISQDQVIDSVWTPSFYGYDGGGSVRQLTNAAGAVTDSYEYDAWGNTISTSGSTPNEFYYRGEQLDSDLGLYYLRARYYNPGTGKFLSQDPYAGNIFHPKSLHRYRYANGNPVNQIDPSGWNSEDEDEEVEAEVDLETEEGERAVAEEENCALYTGESLLEAVSPRAGLNIVDEAVEIEGSECGAESKFEGDEGCCFAAGMPIHTDHGDVPIEMIKVGDEVVSRNRQTGKLESEPVTALTPKHKDSLLELRIEGEHAPLRPSTSHPFWVKRGDTPPAWIAAGKMQVGDFVQTIQGNWRRVVAITPLQDQETVYNFTVAEDHDYFVGETGFLVHNAGGCGCNPPLEPIRFPPEVLHPGTVTPGNPFGLFQYPATGSYGFDEQLLYEAAGIDPGSSEGWVSHHVSYNPRTGNMTGQLVDSDYHSHPHRGGVSDYENATGCEYLP
jgi:RHS repeat-associated protein